MKCVCGGWGEFPRSMGQGFRNQMCHGITVSNPEKQGPRLVLKYEKVQGFILSLFTLSPLH